MHLSSVIAALAFFGAIVICPLVYMIMRHQRTIAELMHRSPTNDLLQRMQLLEQEVRDLRAASYDRLLREDGQRELSRQSQG